MWINTKRKSLKFYILSWSLAATIIIFVIFSKIRYYVRPFIVVNYDLGDKIIEPEIPDLYSKRILVWTPPYRDPINNLTEGRAAFIIRKCAYTNCFVTHNLKYLKDTKKFAVILFNGPDMRANKLPKSRSPHQKYVFAGMESAHYYPVCDPVFKDYFNWTWTYKLNSDEVYGYIAVRNKEGVIIGPKEEMHWMKVEEMKPIDNVLKNKLKTKKYAVAWFVSHCHTRSRREVVVKQLKTEMEKRNLELHIYGKCGSRECPRSKKSECFNILETDYYFYLSFENSFDEDYVTEKLLNALQNYAIPVVFGGANYTRFMPDGIYLDARKLSVVELADKMEELINDKEKYYSYFKWHNYYSYHHVLDAPDSNSYCKLCAMINDDRRLLTTSVYHDLPRWWNAYDQC